MTAHSDDNPIFLSWDEVMNSEPEDGETSPPRSLEPGHFASVAEVSRAIVNRARHAEMTDLAQRAEMAAQDAAAVGDVKGWTACEQIAAYARCEARDADPALSDIQDRRRALANSA